MLFCIAPRTADSFGISRRPASPRGNAMWAIDVQINMTMPPRIPARRIFISRKAEGWRRNLEGKIKSFRLRSSAGLSDCRNYSVYEAISPPCSDGSHKLELGLG